MVVFLHLIGGKVAYLYVEKSTVVIPILVDFIIQASFPIKFNFVIFLSGGNDVLSILHIYAIDFEIITNKGE